MATLTQEAQDSGAGAGTLRDFIAEVRTRYQLSSVQEQTLTAAWRNARQGNAAVAPVAVPVIAPVYGPVFVPFDPTNHITWNIQPPVLIDGVTNGDVASVITIPTDQLNYDAITRGERVTNASTGGRVGVGYHTHMNNNGNGGLAFYYRHTGARDVEPVIYAVASRRDGNIYRWQHGYPHSNTHPPRPGGFV